MSKGNRHQIRESFLLSNWSDQPINSPLVPSGRAFFLEECALGQAFDLAGKCGSSFLGR